MERDEERPDPGSEAESVRRGPPSGSRTSSGRWSGSTAQGPREGPGGYAETTLIMISAAAVVLGVVLFLAGFLTHSLLDDDVNLDPVEEELALLNERTGDIQESLGGAGGDGASPTPAPAPEVSADDDPFIGPEDASVTVIEFSDYQ
jgi:hypothetical protein